MKADKIFSGAIEKFNQTLKRMLFSHMTRYKTRVWADVLQSAIDNYNSTVHSSTAATPEYLHRSADQGTIQKEKKRMEQRNEKWVRRNRKQFKLIRVNDSVRVSTLVFKDYRRHKLSVKSYRQNWSKKIYTVVSISRPAEDWKQP